MLYYEFLKRTREMWDLAERKSKQGCLRFVFSPVVSLRASFPAIRARGGEEGRRRLSAEAVAWNGLTPFRPVCFRLDGHLFYFLWHVELRVFSDLKMLHVKVTCNVCM